MKVACRAFVAPEIPSVQRLLENAEVRALCEAYGREPTVATVRTELEALRRRILAGSAARDEVSTLLDRIGAQVAASQLPSLVRVINATGVVLHTNLGRAPLARQAVDAVRATAGCYSNLEFDLETGRRGSRGRHAAAQLARLSGAEAALVVNNGAAAILLALAAAAHGGEVIVSRGELIEIGGSFRMPEVIAQSGARLVEVGSTNRTRLEDYERAITADTRLILKSHTSNYRIVGFTEAPSRKALAALARRRRVAFVEDLGSGSLLDLSSIGLPAEPTVQECVQDGPDAVTFSGDKLLGGPQAGLLVGRQRFVEMAARHPLARALRADKMTLAALGATLLLYERGTARAEVPALRMLGAPLPVLRRRMQRLVRALRAIPGLECEPGEDVSLPGGGSLPLATQPSAVVRLRAERMSAQALVHALLAGRPPLVPRLQRERVLLDLRTLAEGELHEVPRLVAAALAR